MNGGKIVGFHGKSGWYLDSIGVHLLPLQQQNSSRAPVHALNRCIATGTENHGFSVIQGSIGQNYDIILAVKQREDLSSKPLPPNSNTNIKLSKHFSDDSDQSSISDEEIKEKVRNLFLLLYNLNFKRHEFNSVIEEDKTCTLYVEKGNNQGSFAKNACCENCSHQS